MAQVSRRHFLQVAAGVGAVTALPGLRGAALGAGTDADPQPGPAEGEWLAGDFHVHTTWSHDVWGGPGDDNTDFPDEAYTLGWTPAEQIRNAELRGLDFVALTDHNRIKILDDPGYTSSKLVLVPGYEHSLAYGHAGVFVADRDALRSVFHTFELPEDKFDNFGGKGLAAFIDAVHAAGGVAVINHPADHSQWSGDLVVSQGMDAVEVWNSSWLQRSNVTPQVFTNNYMATTWWDEHFLSEGVRLGVTGGSDNHWRSTTAVQGVGQPTTWVFARNRSAAAIVEGVRAGRTFVSAQPPALGGPRVLVEAVEDWAGGNRAPVVPGGLVRARGPVVMTVRVVGGEGCHLRLVGPGGVYHELLLTDDDTSIAYHVSFPEDGWFRYELYAERGYAMTALTSPVFAAGLAPETVRQAPNQPYASLSYSSPLDVLPVVVEELP